MPRSSLRRVPPSPQVLAFLFMDYLRDGKPAGLSFRQYLRARGYVDPAADVDGMDDESRLTVSAAGGPAFISVPHRKVSGRLRLIVLLIDFEDNAGTRPPQEFTDLLFSEDVFATGSLRDYYHEVSGGKVDVGGTVHGWLRLPKPYSFYVNNESAMNPSSYPRNAQRMAEDAVRAALDAGVEFPAELDALSDETITALFLVHAGRGAEQIRPPLHKQHVWSHKWNLRTPVKVGDHLFATTYLTVPEDCRMGVCAHELGHLAFQWEDFYDPNGDDDGEQWSGSGYWDLMAGGSWNDGGARPAHPVGLHKSQHDWVSVQVVNRTTSNVKIPPFNASGGTVVRVTSEALGRNQFLLLENRRRAGFDDHLPGEGLLVWRVDLDREMTAPTRPALQLVQADGQGDLEVGLNQGDAGDPFPGSTGTTSVTDHGRVSTSFPSGPSGISLSNVAVDPRSGVISFDVTIEAVAPVAAAAAPVVPANEALKDLLKQRTVTVAELRPFVEEVTPSLIDLQREILAATPPDEVLVEEKPKKPSRGKKPAAAVVAAAAVDPAEFGGWWFRRYKAITGLTWDARGKFKGKFTLEPRGAVDYWYKPDDSDPFRFVSADGVTSQPKAMLTDGGSVPRVAWLIKDVNPRAFIKAYLIHDWAFLSHHCDDQDDRTFEQANQTLAEAIYTLMLDGEVDESWWKVETIRRAVSSSVGRGLWDRRWTAAECRVALNS